MLFVYSVRSLLRVSISLFLLGYRGIQRCNLLKRTRSWCCCVVHIIYCNSIRTSRCCSRSCQWVLFRFKVETAVPIFGFAISKTWTLFQVSTSGVFSASPLFPHRPGSLSRSHSIGRFLDMNCLLYRARSMHAPILHWLISIATVRFFDDSIVSKTLFVYVAMSCVAPS